MLQYALLWLLHEQPDYGYHLKRRFEERMGGVWPLNIGQVYQTLQRLQRAGLVCPTHTPASDPCSARRLFELSAKGRRALDRWLRRPPLHPRPVRDENLVRLLVVGAGQVRDVVAQIEEQEASCRRHLSRLLAQKARASNDPALPARHLGLEAERLHAEAHLKWLEYCRRSHEEATPPIPDAATA
jgi:DNA-binding PadR family transcriptional regulator